MIAERRPAVLLTVLVMLCVTVLCAIVVGVSSARALEAKPFAIKRFTLQTTAPTREELLGGTPREGAFRFYNEPYDYTQAGGHPWGLTTTGEFTTEEFPTNEGAEISKEPTRDPRDVVVALPPGLLGNPTAVPRCSLTFVLNHGGNERCPDDTQVGSYVITIEGGHQLWGPIVNVTPAAGQSAEFALENTVPIDTPLLTAHLVRLENPRTHRREYGFTVTSSSIPLLGVSTFELTFWGVPSDRSHDAMRGRFCRKVSAQQPYLECEGGGVASGAAAVPFLSLPTGCSQGPETATIRSDSWEEPGTVGEGHYSEQWKEASATLPGVTGCDRLSFEPSIEAQPDTLLADAPVGLGVSLQVPQNEQPEAYATPHLRDAVVTLPEGLTISPGIVDGIRACDEAGPEGINFDGPESEEVGPSGELQLAPGRCPNASTVGTAEAVTPDLAEPVRGHVYLARPLCGGAGQHPCTAADALDGDLYQLYLELGGSGVLADTGINIKAHGFVEANPATGQITTKFLENPQAPFSELKIHLNGGPRAPLDNPAVCGSATTSSDFTPWSAPGITPEGLSVAGLVDATPSSFFGVEGCTGSPGLSPGFAAGTVSPQAGSFSAFTLNLTRNDREQYVKGIQVHTPPGLLGMLSSVPLCEESAANAGTCPESSRIGTTRVASGAGSHPFEISGRVFLTKSYRGAPFGLSVVTDAVAGPFDLGLVVVRARIAVDPVDSTLTVTTDETGPYAVPQILDGVPLRLKRVMVNIDRAGFMFNPTGCGAKSITATVSGDRQALAGVLSPFAAGGCHSLAFKPVFTVTTSAHTSKANGASLDAKVTYPPFKPGSEANIAYVKVALPKQLPSRLTTLQKACTVQVFDSDPARCPSGSIIGVARTSTPVLPVELSGPVYFVSHGGEAFPSLIVVLQGDGVRVDLTGSTFISRAGITSSTFKTIPDVPVNTFELYLPQGKTSALTANGNLCIANRTVTARRNVKRRVHGRVVRRTVTVHEHGAGLVMPTEFIAQNGAVIHQNTKIAVTGCPKPTTKHAGHPHANRRRPRR